MSKKAKFPKISYGDIENTWLTTENTTDFEEAMNTVSVFPKGNAKHKTKAITKPAPARAFVANSTFYTKEYHIRADAEIAQKELKYIASDTTRYERKLDMHGMRVATAYNALIPFMQEAYCSTVHAVLVITGKGKNSALGQGVLQDAVCTWLAEYPLNEVVKKFGIPHKKHGGDGAIAIFLKPYNRDKKIVWTVKSLYTSIL